MNKQIIPTGVTELLVDGGVDKNTILFEALTDCVLQDIVFMFPATIPNGNATNTCTVKAGGHLFNLASFQFTGTGVVTYAGN